MPGNGRLARSRRTRLHVSQNDDRTMSAAADLPTLRIADLADPVTSIIEGSNDIPRVIERRKLQGPAILYQIGRVSWVNCTFGVADDDPESMLWPVEHYRRKILGVVGLRNVIIRDCELENIGIAGSPQMMDEFRVRIFGHVSLRSSRQRAAQNPEDAAATAPAINIYNDNTAVTGPSMSTGNVTSTGSGIVNVGENIYAKLATTGQGSLAEAIGDYERHLVEAELSPEEKEDQITILQRLGEEAGKPSPNPSRLRAELQRLGRDPPSRSRSGRRLLSQSRTPPDQRAGTGDAHERARAGQRQPEASVDGDPSEPRASP